MGGRWIINQGPHSVAGPASDGEVKGVGRRLFSAVVRGSCCAVAMTFFLPVFFFAYFFCLVLLSLDLFNFIFLIFLSRLVFLSLFSDSSVLNTDIAAEIVLLACICCLVVSVYSICLSCISTHVNVGHVCSLMHGTDCSVW